MPNTMHAWLLGGLTSLMILSAGKQHVLAMTVTAHRWPGSCSVLCDSGPEQTALPSACTSPREAHKCVAVVLTWRLLSVTHARDYGHTVLAHTVIHTHTWPIQSVSTVELNPGGSLGPGVRVAENWLWTGPFTSLCLSDPAIVNGVYWSESLNKVFVDNFDRDPSLIWQYFGSAKGFFRQYPGIKWEPDENGVIAFDCRNRKWYIQAATSPKDVVILVDVSGSMKGLRLTIAKQTVSSILDTLGDDDFFNIIAYNEELHYVEPCLNGTLVQADRTNKEKLIKVLAFH
ncbi:hypothetical protein PANDA_020428 [Ailuropoda melanoleuca]|uniref:VWFA domain-containing protein n=1 Tax=Ailuropoda melanoleuca TaxID=9646 RepID=D2I4C2_AILME|nr:hypothetical protein PANDA_020428 [Ailuropoda melanoleuca]